jgi:predicted transposase YbfD/YdcC
MRVQSATPRVVSTILDMVTDCDQFGSEVGLGPDRSARSVMRAVWAEITDPRDMRGRRHRLPSILALVQAAVVAGATTFTAIKHWIAVAPQGVRGECGVRLDRRTGRYRPPHPDTVTRLLEQLDPVEVDAAYARHRMGAFLHEDAIMVATCDVDGKTNEINAFAPLLDQIDDLQNVVVTGDATHCRRKHAAYLRSRAAHYVFPVLGNQPGLSGQLDALAWRDVPVGWMTYDRGHGRQEIRTIQVMPPQGTRFPHAKQVFLIERHVRDLNGAQPSTIAVLGITDLTPNQAGPRQIYEFARGQWSIENPDHYVRDVTLGEDPSRVRTAATPSILATMRSYAISALRLLGFTNIAEGTRWARDDLTHPLIALRLT